VSFRQGLILVLSTLALYAFWAVIAQRFLMGLPAATGHQVSAGVGALLALLITWVSVRVIERQQRELAKLARLKEELTQMVVHDLRTPLTAMIGSLETVQAGVVGEVSAGAAEMTEIALEGSRSLLRMVNDLLDIARMEAGESIVEIAETDVEPIVQEAAEMIARLAEARGLRFTTVVESRLPRVQVDGEKIRRLLVNLLGNAVKFTPSGGQVELRVTWDPARRRLIFTVADTGEGIPPEDRERIFDKFGQVATRKAGHKMSTGLGLTFCKLVARAHGGSIRVESEVGKGSTFIVEIPAETSTALCDSGEPRPSLHSARPRRRAESNV
jgi:signal transduction histidine kinase